MLAKSVPAFPFFCKLLGAMVLELDSKHDSKPLCHCMLACIVSGDELAGAVTLAQIEKMVTKPCPGRWRIDICLAYRNDRHSSCNSNIFTKVQIITICGYHRGKYLAMRSDPAQQQLKEPPYSVHGCGQRDMLSCSRLLGAVTYSHCQGTLTCLTGGLLSWP